MKKRLTIAVACSLTLMLGVCACSPKNITDPITDLENQLIDEEDAMEDPQFWAVSSPVSDNTNLYQINSASFEGKPYISLHKFGDCILLIGSADYEESSTNLELPVGSGSDSEESGSYCSDLPQDTSDTSDSSDLDADDYTDSSDDYEDDSDIYYSDDYEDDSDIYYSDDYYEGDPGDVDYQFSFDVYSPWRDSITYSISHDETDAQGYYAFDSGVLVTYTYDQPCSVKVYNDKLEEVAQGSFDDSEGEVGFLCNLFQLKDPDTFYSYTYDDDSLITYHVESDGTITESRTEAPLYGFSITAADQAGEYLVVNGVDPETMIYVEAKYDPSTGLLTEIGQYQSYGSGSFCGDSYIFSLPSRSDIMEFVQGDGSTTYMEYSYYDEKVLPDSSLILPNSDYDEETDSTLSYAYLYDSDGNCLSGYRFSDKDISTSEDEIVYLDSEMAVFPDQQLAFMLQYSSCLHPCLLAWDYSEAGSYSRDLTLYTDPDQAVSDKIKENYESEPEYYDLVTKIDDPDTYDWGDLAEAHAKAEELSQKYGVEIYIGPEVPDVIDAYYLGEMNDPDLLMDSLETFDSILEMYPENFLQQLCYSDISGLRFYFTGSITGDEDGYLSEAAAYVTSQYNHKVMVMDCNYNWDLDYTLNHEFSHMIDARLAFVSLYRDCRYSEDTWSALNEGDFEYQYTYSDYADYSLPDDVYTYILDPYASTYPTEDRAMIFGYACQAYLEDDYYMAYSYTDQIDAKLEYYSTCIREGFDTTGWPETLPWEYMLEH